MRKLRGRNPKDVSSGSHMHDVDGHAKNVRPFLSNLTYSMVYHFAAGA